MRPASRSTREPAAPVPLLANGDRMKQPERGAPVPRRESPNPNRASCQNNGRRTLREDSEPEKRPKRENCNKVASASRQGGISRAAQCASVS